MVSILLRCDTERLALSRHETDLFMAPLFVLVKVLGAVANILDRCVGARAKRGVGGTASKVDFFVVFKNACSCKVDSLRLNGGEGA